MPHTLDSLAAKIDTLIEAIETLKNTEKTKDLISPGEAAKRYRINRNRVIDLIQRGELPAAIRPARRGQRSYLISAKAAERVLGAH